ncbi:MAG TPA: hypothetical protein VF175_09280 [Lacipirellula sp.]
MKRSVLYLLLALSNGSAAWGYEADDHWTRTATEGPIGVGGSVGLPAILTWSFVPDGTPIPGNNGGTTPSNLRNFLDTNWPGGSGSDLTQRPWFEIFEQAFDRLGALSGLTFVYEPADSGIAFADTTAARGALGARGDIRIGGKSYGSGSNTLASNYGPDYGEMMINTDKASFFRGTFDDFRGFRNTIMHEAMHGVGIAHVESSTSGFLIEPILSTSFDGPQLDDILALQRLYGDVYEKGFDNNASRRATPLGVVSTTQSQTVGANGGTTTVSDAHTDFISIDDDSDVDFFRFTLQESVDVTLSLTPQGTTYSVGRQGQTQASFNSAALNDLTLALIDRDGFTTLATSATGGLGAGETIVRQLEPGDYFVKVTGVQNDIQLYKLQVSAAVMTSDALVWMAATNNEWDNGVTANFTNRFGPDTFRDGDQVVFDDRAASHDVLITQDVAPASIAVEGADDYVFSGPGGVVGGSLRVGPGAALELANSGNSYAGETEIAGGTLKITGDAGALVSDVTIASGGLLVLDPSEAGAMASLITVDAGGTLQIGTAASERNVFPDVPAGVVNDGTVRVLDSERISRISGGGHLIVEQVGVELADNNAFNGLVTVKSGAVADVTDAAGLGADLERTVVEAGGAVRVDLDGALSEGFSLSGAGGGLGALRFAAGRNMDLLAEVSLTSGDVAIGVEQAADIEMTGLVSAATAAELTLDVAESALLQLNNGVVLAGGGLTKRGRGAAAVRGTVMEISGADVQEGRLLLGGSGAFDGEFLVAQNAVLELNDPTTFSETTVLTGGGQVAGVVTMAGTIAPGPEAAQLEFTGDLTLMSTSLVQLEAGGLTAGETFDQLAVLGAATLGGTFELAIEPTFTLSSGDMFEVLRAGEVLGAFDALSLPALDAALAWDVAYLPTSVVLTVTPAAATAPADFNGDGVVDAGDLQVWAAGFGGSAESGPLAGDADGDLFVDGRDFLTWQQSITPVSTSAAAAVPEPHSLAGALLGCLLLPALRRTSPHD